MKTRYIESQPLGSSVINSRQPQQRGFTLVELMIGLMLSIFISALSVTYMLSSSRMLTNQNSEDLIQENARFAFEMISSVARLANSNTSIHPDSTTEGITTEPECPGNVQCNTDNFGYTLGGTAYNSDRVAVDYITSIGTTCTGNAILDETKLLTVFYVDDVDGDGIPSLYCQSYRAEFDTIALDFDGYTAGTPVALIDGVDSLQVQYGVDDDGDNDVDRYSAYSNVAAADIANIRSLRVALLIGSGQSIVTEQNTLERLTRNYQVYESAVSKTDGVLRRIFSTTIFLPNLAS